MKKCSKKLLQNSILLLIGITAGYLIYYYVFLELVALFIGRGFTYYFVSILCLIGSMIGCIILLNVIFYKKFSKLMFIAITIMYFCILFSVLFLRRYTEQIYIFNPLVSLKDLFNSKIMLFQSFMNFIIFIPIGYFFKKFIYKKVIVLSTIFSTLIELCQVITMRGFFDILDIVIYVLGITMGYFIFRKIKLDIK